MREPSKNRVGEAAQGESSPSREEMATRVVVIVILTAVLCYSTVRLTRMAGLGGSFDSALLQNVTWRLAHGYNSQTALTGGHYISTHSSPILVLLVLLARLFPGPDIWLPVVGHAASAGLAAWATYSLGRHLKIEPSRRVALVIAMLASSAVWMITQHQLNETTLGVGPLAMVGALAFQRVRLPRITVWATIAASCRLEMALAVLMVGVVLWTVRRRKESLMVSGVATAFLAGYLSWMFLNPYETESVAAHFAHLGSSPQTLIASVLTRPWVVFEPVLDALPILPILLWTLPFAIIAPFLAWRWLLIALPPAAVAILGVWPPADNMIEHYWSGLFAAGAIAAPIAISRTAWLARRLYLWLAVGVLCGWMLVVPLFWYLFPAEVMTSADRSLAEQVDELDVKFVSAPTQMATYLVERPWFAPFPRPFSCFEDSVGPYTAPDVPPSVIITPRGFLEDSQIQPVTSLVRLLDSYEQIGESENFVAWRVVDSEGAAAAYVPCSSATFSISP